MDNSHLGIGTRNMGELYPLVLDLILERGVESSPRQMKTKELLGATVFLTDARNSLYTGIWRNLNYKFAVAEWLWIMAGRSDVASLARYNKNIAQFSDNGVTFAGAYGPRICSQLHHVFKCLSEPDSRQAVITVWEPCPARSKDIPCTVSLQFLLREKLHLIVTMRSSDAWLGLPYDIHNFSMIQNAIAGALNVEVGFIQMQLSSLHLYDRDWENAERVVSNSGVGVLNQKVVPDYLRTPKLPGLPPARWILETAEIGDWSPIVRTAGEPWNRYVEALICATKAEALEVLRRLSDANAIAAAK
jgi:thymidylate synthase